MKKYKVEARTYYSKVSFDNYHIIKSSTEEIQAMIDDYVLQGGQLCSTDTASFGMAQYNCLYFEKDMA